MPGFIHGPKDEARWSKAKKAASKTLSEADGNSYWALTNSIYHKMMKSEVAKALLDKLSKVSYPDEEEEEEQEPEIQDWGNDDEDDNEDDLEAAGMHEIDPDEEGSDDTEKWLSENDPEKKQQAAPTPSAEPTPSPEEAQQEEEQREVSPSGYADWEANPEYTPKQTTEIKTYTDQGYSPREAERMAGAHRGPTNFQDALTHRVRPSEMSPRMLKELKELAAPWLANAERHRRMNADPEKNPMKHAAGQMQQAHEGATKDYSGAYNAFLNSENIKNLKGIQRVKAIQAWKNDWKAKNPEYNQNLSQVGQQVRGHAAVAKEKHRVGLEDRLQHVLTGGAQDPTATFSAAEAAQHVGGAKTDEGYAATTTVDPAASFAQQNRAALEKLRTLRLKPEHEDRLKRTDSARAALGVAKQPTVIRRPGGGKT